MIVDAQGNPVSPDISRFIPIIINDLRNMAGAQGHLQKALLMSEIKLNFLINLLDKAGLLPEDIDEQYQAYQTEQLNEIQAQNETVLDPEVPLPDLMNNRGFSPEDFIKV